MSGSSTVVAADEIIVIERGRVVERGPHEELPALRCSLRAAATLRSRDPAHQRVYAYDRE